MVVGRFEPQVCEKLYKLRHYISSRISPREVAEDVYGDVIVKMWGAIRGGKLKASLSVDAFIWRCAWCVLCDYYKKEGRKKRTDNGEYGYYLSMLIGRPEREYEASTINNAFMARAGKELNDTCRKILILLLFQNMKHRDIADTLGIPRATVSTYLLKMRKQFGGINLNKVRTRATGG